MSHPQQQQQQQKEATPKRVVWSPAPTRPQLRPILAMGTSYLPVDIQSRHVARHQELTERQAAATARWSLEQLRASDAIIRVQSGSNQNASQKGMAAFGGPRDVVQGVAGLHKLEDEARLVQQQLAAYNQQYNNDDQLIYYQQPPPQQQQQQYQ